MTTLSNKTATASKSRTFADLFHNVITAWIILIVSTLVTITSWNISTQYVTKRSNDRFDYKVEEARLGIVKRMQEYEQVLRGGVGLFKSSEEITRQEWRAYVETLNIDTYWPGIQGFGFARMISPENLASHEKKIRQEGFPDYAVKPKGERDLYSAIIFLEPFDYRNKRAFGYDMFSNPIRRAAMELARDSGQAAVSGRVTLVQETDQDVQAGFLMYLPLYQKGAAVASVEERRGALEGFVYSPFRMKDLLNGILGHGDPDLEFQIFDGDSPASANLLYSTLPAKVWTERSARSLHAANSRITLAGRTWTTRFQSRPKFEQEMESSQPLIIAVLGMTVDVLLFLVLMSLSSQRDRIQTEARRIGLELNAAESHSRVLAEEANRAKSEFLANMSHELRTPLNSMLILSKILAQNEGGNLTNIQITSAEVIHASGTDLLRLINDILDLSKIEVGRMDILIDEMPLDQFARNIERMFKPLAENKGLEFRITIDPGLDETINTDWAKIEQIIRNFLSNAIKFTAHGHVQLRISKPDDTISLHNPALHHNNTIVMTVQDSGIGISPDKQDWIFEAFRQGDGTTSRQYGGTGLGLSISRKLATLLGCEIQLESQEGKGSAFSLYIPLDFSLVRGENQRENRVGPAKPTSKVLKMNKDDFYFGSQTVLIVDDDERNIFALKQALKPYVGQILIARNGQEALQVLAEQADIVDLVLMDIMMPIMDGFKAIQAIRKQVRFHDLPILALTAKARSEDREKCLRFGANDFLAKPVDHQDLLVALSNWLNNSARPGRTGTRVAAGEIGSTMVKSDQNTRSILSWPGTPIKVLIVDDDMRNTFSMAQLLQQKGARTVMAKDGVKALMQLEKHPDISIVLMDVNMPNMGGLETTKKIRENPIFKDLPIIAITGTATPDDQVKCLQFGMNAYIAKPVDVDVLLDKISELLNIHSESNNSFSDTAGGE
ncbi:MAG: CHASE domain-containing protein [Magnetococcales bacterium]|nr:CHASE domain-containing protein [Magnetococcales bacterium]